MSGPAKKAERKPLECCRYWAEIPADLRAQWSWQVLHRFAHSRTTFSAETLARVGRVPAAQAAELVASGEARKWIWTPQTDLWVGRLASRR